MEEEAREILKAGVREKIAPPGNLGTAIRRLFEPLGGVDLEIPPRQPMRNCGADFSNAAGFSPPPASDSKTVAGGLKSGVPFGEG